MTAESMAFFTAALHSVILAALGWLLVRWCIRDARRRAFAAQMTVIFVSVAPWTPSLWPDLDPAKDDAPALARIHQALQPDWRIKVSHATAEFSVPDSTQATAPMWNSDHVAKSLRWIWVGGAGVMLLRHLWLSLCLLRWRKLLRHPTVEELARMPQSFRVTELRVFDHAGTPCVTGLRAPVIAVPAAAFETLTARQWHWMVRHEEEHIRGRDLGISWVFGVIRALGWWNPFIHALIECWTRAREEVCDAAAVQNTQAHAAYADFLLAVASVRQTTMAGVMPISQSKPARRLRARLEALMASQSVRDRAGWLFHVACLVVIVLSHALIASLGFTSSVQGAEPVPAASEDKAADGQMFTRIYRVPPSFGGGIEIKGFLEKNGITFPGKAAAKHNKAMSQIIALNTRANLQRIEQIVRTAFVSPVQVLFSCKIIDADKHFGKQGQVLQDPEFQALIRAISQTKGVDILSAPTVTAKLEQRATVEVIRQKEPNDDTPFVGLKVHLNSQTPKANKVAVSIQVEIGVDMSREYLLPLAGGGTPDWTQVKVFTTEAKPLLASGETSILHFDAGEKRITVLVTATALKPNREFATSFDQKIDNAPLPRKGDDALMPAEAYGRREKAAEDVETALARKQIYLSVIVAKVSSQDATAEISQLLGMTPGKPVTAALPAGVPLLSGVLTNPQFEVFLRALHRRGKTQLNLPSQTLHDEEEAVFALPEAIGGQKLTIAATKSAYGTLDLSIAAALPESRGKNITTSVTIWDGQTVLLSDVGNEADKVESGQWIFITARLIDPLSKPKSK